MIESLRTQMLVVSALILRDIGTRFGRRPINYVFVLALPVAHFTLTAAAWIVLKRPVPIGTSKFIFFATGLLPFVVWTFPYRQINQAVNANRPMLYFPRVKVIDLMIARSILEVLTGFTVIVIATLLLIGVGEDVRPRDPFLTLSALMAAMYFGIAFGMFNGLIAAMYKPWAMPMTLMSPMMWGTCGAAFMINTIPLPYRDWLALNPLLQCVEWMREAYYWDYRSEVLDRVYVLEVSTALIVLVLLVERMMRGRILQG